MSHRVRIKAGHEGIQLPNGFAYNAGAEVTLTDDEFESLSAEALTDLVDDITPVIGGAPAGVAIVRKFPFAFDAANLVDGHVVYTPTVGDILLDLWVSVITPWNGTTPIGDVGTFDGSVGGFFSWQGYVARDGAGGGIPMTYADVDAGSAGGFGMIGTAISLGSAIAEVSAVTESVRVQNNGNPVWLSAAPNFITQATRPLPAVFTTDDPIKVVVSTDGTTDGADPGSTQGAAILYLVTATPA